MSHVEHKARVLRDFLDHDHVGEGAHGRERHYQPWDYGPDGVVRRQLRALCRSLLSEIDIAARLHSPDRAQAHHLQACSRCGEGEQEFGGLCRWCDAFEYGDDYLLGGRDHKGGRVVQMEAGPTTTPTTTPCYTLYGAMLVPGEAIEVLLDAANGAEPWVWKQGVFRIASDRSVSARPMVVVGENPSEWIGCTGRRVRRIRDKR